MARYIIFPEKLILKWNEELVELHKRCIKTYLVQENLSASARRKFFMLYDKYVNARNIIRWFYLPVDLFVKILLYNQLEEMSNYTFQNNSKKRRKRNAKK